MTQTLYLLRHAKAEPWSLGINDFERGLNHRGRHHMRRLSAWMAENLALPDTVLCSSARRTRETLSPILDTWPAMLETTSYFDDIYEATTGTLHALAEHAFAHSSTTLMVGHNPGFEYLAMSLIQSSEAGGPNKMEIGKMATGTLAVIDFPAGYAQDSGQGILRHWMSRKNLQVLAD